MDKVKINRNNYEEYLLLYVDDELSASDKEQVNAFLLKNPDLAEELDMLRDTKISDDQMLVFKHKELLYKTCDTKIHSHNCEEWFLLYTDNELSDTEKEAVDNWVAKHPVYKQQLEILIATRVPQEQVFFANKEILHRREVAKLVSFAPMRWVAAAAIFVLLSGVWLLWKSNTPAGQQQVAETNTIVSPPVSPSKDLANSTADINTPEAIDVTDIKKTDQTSADKATAKNDAVKKSTSIAEQAVNVKENKIADDVVTNNPEQPYEIAVTNEIIAGSENKTTVASYIITDVEVNESINSIVYAALAEKVQNITDTDVAMHTQSSINASYSVLQTGDEKNNFYVGSLNLNKNKVKGLLRKAGKIFNDKTQNIAAANSDIIKTTSGSIKK